MIDSCGSVHTFNHLICSCEHVNIINRASMDDVAYKLAHTRRYIVLLAPVHFPTIIYVHINMYRLTDMLYKCFIYKRI